MVFSSLDKNGQPKRRSHVKGEKTCNPVKFRKITKPPLSKKYFQSWFLLMHEEMEVINALMKGVYFFNDKW